MTEQKMVWETTHVSVYSSLERFAEELNQHIAEGWEKMEFFIGKDDMISLQLRRRRPENEGERLAREEQEERTKQNEITQLMFLVDKLGVGTKVKEDLLKRLS